MSCGEYVVGRRKGDPVVAAREGLPYAPNIPASARLFIFGALLLSAIWYYAAPLDYFAVRAACRRDGGLNLQKTVNVDGYWHGGYQIRPDFDRADCLLCAEQVAAGDFRY